MPIAFQHEEIHMTQSQFDRRKFLSVGAIGIAASAIGLRTGLAQDATPAVGGEVAHPAHIHSGTCEELGDVVFPLNDVAPLDAGATPAAVPASPAAVPAASPVAAGAGEVVAESTTEVEASLDDILAAEHAINVHESAENIGNYIACGNLTGPATDGELQIKLQELNDSGYTGEAHLVDNGDGTTTVTVTLMTTSDTASTPEAAQAADEATPAAVGEVVAVELDEFEVRMPSKLAAGPTTFRVTNVGGAEHNFEVEGQGIEEEFEENLRPGEVKEMTLDLQPGTYEVYCPVGNHEDMGMRLELTVT
jgi:uncharacterized cupredoxin-like copper-binding protein